MKHRFTITIVNAAGHTLHHAQVAAESADDLASYIRKVANVIKDLDFPNDAATEINDVSNALQRARE